MGISQRLSTAFHQGSPKNPLFSPLVHQYHGDEFTTARKEIFTMLPKRIGFIGAGQMAEALAKGFISKGVSQPENMLCTDPSQERKKVFQSFGVKVAESNVDLAKSSDIIFIAVKPQYVSVVLNEISGVLTPQSLIVSIAAGVSIDTLQSACKQDFAKVIRVMPNTPCLVGEAAAAMCLGKNASTQDESDVRTLMGSVGKIFTCTENLLSAVTGLSGSGPAYIFIMIEALSDGGVRAGLPRDVALQLAAQTVLGSAKMVLETGKHPGALKDAVTSPGGTTIAGVHELEKAGVRAAFINAVLGAANRADEMAKM